MRCLRSVIVVAGVIGCGACAVKPGPNGIGLVKELYRANDAGWYFRECRLIATRHHRYTRRLRVLRANVALVHSYGNLGEKTLWFRCPKRPPWIRQDAHAVLERYHELSDADFACAHPYTPLKGKPLQEVQVIERGRADVNPVGKFVHARLRDVGWTFAQEKRIHHGRLIRRKRHPDYERAAEEPSGTQYVVNDIPMEWVGHMSCWTPCERQALSKIGPGGKVRVVCGESTQELELLAVGDKELFRKSLALEPNPAPIATKR